VLWQAYSPMGRQINFRIWHFLAEGIENRADILATTPREGTCALGHVLNEAKRRSTAASRHRKRKIYFFVCSFFD
jgi:hypothetical protein